MTFAKDANKLSSFEMTADLRDLKTIEKAKYNDQCHTLNANGQTYRNVPQLRSDQAGCDLELHYLEKLHIILRTEPDSKKDDAMQLKLISTELPFPVKATIELSKGLIIPAVDLRVVTQQFEKYFLACIGKELIRFNGANETWTVSTKVDLDYKTKTPSIFVLMSSDVLVIHKLQYCIYSEELQLKSKSPAYIV